MRQHPSVQRRLDSLQYVQSLREITQAERCDIIAYLIEMAYVETSDVIRGERPMRSRPSVPVTRSQKGHSAA